MSYANAGYGSPGVVDIRGVDVVLVLVFDFQKVEVCFECQDADPPDVSITFMLLG